MKLLEPLTDKHGKCWPACPGLRARPGSRGPRPASRKQDVCGRRLPGADSECWHCPLAWGLLGPGSFQHSEGLLPPSRAFSADASRWGWGRPLWNTTWGTELTTGRRPGHCQPDGVGCSSPVTQAGEDTRVSPGKLGKGRLSPPTPLPWPRSDGDTGRSSLPPPGLFSTPLGSSPSGCLACTPRHITPSPHVSL